MIIESVQLTSMYLSADLLITLFLYIFISVIQNCWPADEPVIFRLSLQLLESNRRPVHLADAPVQNTSADENWTGRPS